VGIGEQGLDVQADELANDKDQHNSKEDGDNRDDDVHVVQGRGLQVERRTKGAESSIEAETEVRVGIGEEGVLAL
jgi:hypothetical protein